MFITSNYKEDSIKGKFERQFFNEYSSSDTAERNTVRYASAPDKNVQIWSTPTLSICRTAANAF